ncbi:polyprotein of EF-Ts, chloroplastic isoform X1 [Rhododendron vialii]|uniref:polyprotein of EF-Ts, chloroplastic isoform X1 n=1 Tax=Rhododendron vialii TaxID=182163 RepID=UPI00265EAE48|nr:polyprotein of EF-Ts, chloroplastic isoform X1 [Rhododendron vialii]
MTTVISSSINNVLLINGTPFATRKTQCLKRCNLLKISSKHAWSSQKCVLPLSRSVGSLPRFRSGFFLQRKSRIHITCATGSESGTDLAIEEADSPIADEDSSAASEIPTDAVGTSEESPVKSDASIGPAQSRRSSSTRKSEMPPVKPEELVPGAAFTGKVMSIQPFGAFVDFGAFTDGLVHVSQLSDGFVKDVGDVVSVGQEVKVRLVEVNMETKRISLTMRESANTSEMQQRKDSPASSDEGRPPRTSTPRYDQKRDDGKKSFSNFELGQELVGIVKNLTRSGAFISLPDGEEGFLPSAAEEMDDGFNPFARFEEDSGSSVEIGEEVNVRVLRISGGRVILTKKPGVKKVDDDINDDDEEEENGAPELMDCFGAVHKRTNPFLLAFHKNEDIAAFLDQREKEEKFDQTGTMVEEVQDQQESTSEGLVSTVTGEDETSSKEVNVLASTLDASNEMVNDVKDPHIIVSDSSDGINGAVQSLEEVTEVRSQILAREESVSASDQLTEGTFAVDQSSIENQVGEEVTKVEVSSRVLSPEGDGSAFEVVSTTDGLENVGKEDLSGQITNSFVSDSAISEEVAKIQADDAISKDEVLIVTPNAEIEPISATIVEEVGINPDNYGTITSSNDQIVFPTVQQSTNEESQVSGEAEKEIDNLKVQNELKVETPGAESEIASATLIEDEKVVSVPDKYGTVTNSNGQNGASSSKESTAAAEAISPLLVKQLRDETGAGMMDCKKALSESGGDLVKAQEFLRKKGLASADKKASRATAEGRIGAYIHDSRIGVLIEVNCETDFVSRGEIFKELVDDLAMQVAACPQVQYLATDDVPKEAVEKEREIEMQKEDLLSKPEQIRSRIVDGRIKKRLDDLALLEQPYIKNDKLVVKDWVKQTIATIGENIKVKRFERFNLGEGLEKKSHDFAAEVAAQTAAKSVVAPSQPDVVEAVDKPQKATVSAALVKQLREETGAGMMDCKKALSETEGDLGKAQEYLRKKGLSTADKKSSRLAAEGRIGSYIHDSRIGVLIEVNCETDFVGRGEKFKELVDDLAMQVVACPQVQYVSIEDVPESIVIKEKELEMQREDLQSKPENIRERIVEGRISKRLGEVALLEQPFIKNDSILVKDLVKQTVAALGENIKVRRFVRFTLGDMNETAETENEA